MVKVLVVDDEPLEREAISYILGHERPEVKVVGEAGSGRVALELTRKLRPDIVFMDIQMPGVSGLEATQALKELAPEMKVVVLTAYDEFDFAQRALKLGASDYLLKPARPAEILRVTDAMCRELAEAAAREEEEKRLRQELAAIMPYIETGLLLDLVSGRTENKAQLTERARFLGLAAGPYQVLLVDIDHFAQSTSAQREVERQVLKKEVHQALVRVAREAGPALVSPFGSDTFLVLTRAGNRPSARELAESLRREVARATPCTVTVGVGTVCLDLGDVAASYAAAQRAVQYGSFLGADQVVESAELGDLRLQAVAYPYQRETRLAEKVQLGEGEAARALFEQLWQELVGATAGNPELARARALELAVVLTRAALQGGAGPEVLTVSQRASLAELTAAATAAAVKEWAAGVLERCLAAVSASQAALRSEAIAQAKKYLAEHFSDPVSLEDVARQVHLSPFYFSRLFKEKEGVNFVEYLTRLRLEEAKRLLARTNETIAAVAARVGYAEANYFSRIFRRHFGLSPSEYREKRPAAGAEG